MRRTQEPGIGRAAQEGDHEVEARRKGKKRKAGARSKLRGTRRLKYARARTRS